MANFFISIGFWVNNKLQGQATEKWQNGFSYSGNYEKGVKEGYGTFQYSDGRRYAFALYENSF